MQKVLLILSLCMVSIFSPTHADSIYKWHDARGLTHYTMAAPDTADAEVIQLPAINLATLKSINTFNLPPRYLRERAARFILISGRDDERAAQEYDRKYGAVARLKRLEAEKRQKKHSRNSVNANRPGRMLVSSSKNKGVSKGRRKGPDWSPGVKLRMKPTVIIRYF